MKINPQTLVAVLLSCLFTLTTANAADVTAKTSASAVRVAEPLTFDLTVSAPAGTKIVFPSVSEKLGEFDVIDHHDLMDIPAASDANQRTWNRRFTLESITTGDLQIPAMELQVVANGKTETLTTADVPVQVLSVLEGKADPTQFRDIRSVVDVDVPKPTSNAWLWWTLTGGGTSLLALAGIMLVARRKTWMTPAVWAIRELEQLKSSPAMQSGDSDTVCQDISGILRDYLELQYEISAPVQTTEELLQVIEHRNELTPETIKGFADVFTSADQARFAGLQLTKEEQNSIIDDAQQWIATTNQPQGVSPGS